MASILGVETLQHTNGTTAATIDSSGDITFPNRKLYHWHVSRTAGNVSATNDIIFNNTHADDDSVYNSTTGVVTVPVAGVYQINFAGTTNTSNNTVVGLYDSSNNLLYNISGYGNGHSWYTNVSFSVALKLDANDTLKMRVTTNTLYAGNGSGAPNFSGFLVG